MLSAFFCFRNPFESEAGDNPLAHFRLQKYKKAVKIYGKETKKRGT